MTMQAIAALPCATPTSQFGYGGIVKRKSMVARFGNPRRAGLLVARSKQPDVEKEKGEVSGFEMPARGGAKEKRLASQLVDEERRVERMFSNVNEVSLKHEPGEMR